MLSNPKGVIPSPAVPPIVNRHVDSLSNHPDQPRGKIQETDPKIVDLTNSIIEKGILEPLLITPDNKILAGHRRRVASRAAYKRTGIQKFLHVPCIIRKLAVGEDPLETMLHENMQRESLTLAEEANAFLTLMQRQNLSVAALARKISIPAPTISSRLAITKCADEVQSMFDADVLPLSAAPWLAKVADKDEHLKLANMVARKQMTLERLERVVRARKSITTASPGSPSSPIPRSLTRKPQKRKDSSLKPQPQLEPTRAEAVAALEKTLGKSVKLFDVKLLLNSVCTACGMLNQPDICRTCPLPRLILGIVGRSSEPRS